MDKILLYPSLQVPTVSTFELFHCGKQFIFANLSFQCLSYIVINLSTRLMYHIVTLDTSTLHNTPHERVVSLRLDSACVHNTDAIIHFYITLFLYKFGSLTGACAGVPRGPRCPRAQCCVSGPILSGLATLYILYRPIRLLSPFKCQHTTEALRWIENVPNCSGHGIYGYTTI